MLRRKGLIAAVGAALLAASAAFAPAAHAHDRVGFNVSIAGPGYGVTFGNAPVYYGPRHWHHRPHWRPVYVPPPVYVAPPVVYRAPVIVEPAPIYYYPDRVYYRY